MISKEIKDIVIFQCELTDAVKAEVLQSNKFIDWYLKVKENFSVTSINIKAVTMFGKKVGFIYLEAVAEKDEKILPGAVFIRGGSVGILTILNSPSGTYTAMVSEDRVPAGENILSIPAGMIDGESLTGVSLKELQEELGSEFVFSVSDLTWLTSAYTTPGGSDEFVDLYFVKKDVSDEFIAELHGRETGAEDEAEYIKVEVMTLKEALDRSQVMFAKTAILTYLLEH